MSNGNIFHALGLHMHQPPGNMQVLIEDYPGEAQQIIHCYDRATRYAHKYKDVATLHIGFSGILLEQLRDPVIVDRYRQYIDIPAMLNSYREAANIELIGMGYYHPIFPLIPADDWADQLTAGRQMMEELFGRAPKGFWPPEMAFTLEMIPALVKAGYEYVVLDSRLIQPTDGALDIYQPYLASHGGASIVVVPRDCDISKAQESGIDPAWFANEARHKAGNSPHPDQPRLITTWSDGENGGWFRQMEEQHGFFGHFFGPYIEHVRNGEYPVTPVSLSQFIKDLPPQAKAEVHNFSQWQGSEGQTQALTKIRQVSAQVAASKLEAAKQARHLLLESETSCFMFWGDHWLHKIHERLEQAENLLNAAEEAAKAPPAAPEAVKTKAEPVPAPVLAKPEEKTAEKPVEEKSVPVKQAEPAPIPAKPAEKAPVKPTATKAPATKKTSTSSSRSKKK